MLLESCSDLCVHTFVDLCGQEHDEFLFVEIEIGGFPVESSEINLDASDLARGIVDTDDEFAALCVEECDYPS